MRSSIILRRLERVRRFNRWMAESIRPYVGARVLEVGAGIGSVTEWILPRDLYVATDVDQYCLGHLRAMSLGKPWLEVKRIDVEDPACLESWRGRFDTLICLNVLEHLRDPHGALMNMAGVLEKSGRLLLYVPQNQRLYCSLDEVLGHRCRYSREDLRGELAAARFDIEFTSDFNRLGVLGWWWNGRLCKRRNLSSVQLTLFDAMVPLLRRVDRLLPWAGLGLLVSARRQ